MTFREKMAKDLYDSGLFEDQAAAILEAYLARPEGKLMTDRWDEDVSGYPNSVIKLVWLGVQSAAVKWIDANCPKHWARAMFV